MARFFTIASGSSGNCAYLGSADRGILVDAGVSCKSIAAGLAQHNVLIEDVHGIFITHEHIDHIRGLKVFLKRYPMPVYASAQVLDYLATKGHVPPGTMLEEVGGMHIQVGDVEAQGFDTSHDSVHSQGYRFRLPDGRVMGVATDLGYVSDTVHDAMLGCDLALLESNYEHAMLMSGAYPYYLKKRIAGREGHLSNEACAALALELVEAGTTRLVLAHLSKENNMPDLADQSTDRTLAERKMRRGTDYLLSVAPRSQPSEMMVF